MRQHRRGIAAVILLAMFFSMISAGKIYAAKSDTVYNGMDYSDVYNYQYYKNNNPDLKKAFGNNAGAYIAHFVEHGMAEGRVASSEFDVNYYRMKYPDLNAVLKNDTKAYYIHYITSGKAEGRVGCAYAVYNGMDYSDVFDYADYRAMNPDLNAAFGNNKELYIAHFVEHGMAERRGANARFNVNLYMENYPDLRSALGTDFKAYYVHYILYGKAEGRTGAYTLGENNGNIVWIEHGEDRYCMVNGAYAVGYQQINGRWYYFNEAGQLCSRFGIDVSTYNGDINWQAAKADGVEFAMIRLGYGENLEKQDDAKAIYNMMSCEWLGIPYGVYLYSYALNESGVQSEIDHVLRVLGGRVPELGVYIDMEDADNYKLRRNALNNQTLQNICMQFVDTFTAMGYKSGIYASRNWMNDKLGNAKTASYTNWIAQWNKPCDYRGNFVFWQSSSTGRVNGVNGLVDTDAWIYRR